MNKNTILLTLAGLASIASSDAQNNISFKNAHNIDKQLISELVYSISEPTSIVLAFDLYCQPTPEDRRKREVYFKKPDSKTYVPLNDDPIIIERMPLEAIATTGQYYDFKIHAKNLYKYAQRNFHSRQKVASKYIRN